MKTNKEIVREFDALLNDVAKWRWVKENQNTGVIINLDNDDTFGVLPDDPEDNYILQFNHFIGWSDGIQDLLGAMGIESTCV